MNPSTTEHSGNHQTFEVHPAPGTGAGTQQHIPALDGLRGIAVLLILVFHFHFIFTYGEGLEGGLYRWLDFGWCGVDLFFALSGFLITGILLDTRKSRNSFGIFYARRALRIFPLYYLFLLFVFALNQSHYFIQSMRFAPTNWGWYLLYLQNVKPTHNIRLAHLWSLALEEQFYLFWPAFVYWMPSRFLLRASVLVVICCLAFRCFLLGAGIAFPYIFTSVFTRLDELVLGSLVAMIVRDPALVEYVRRRIWIAVSAGLLVLLAVVIDYRLMDAVGLTAIGLLFSSSVFLVARSTGTLARVLSVSWLRAMGRYGYGIYVLHPMMFAATSGPLRHALTNAPAALVVPLKLGYVPVMIGISFLAGKLSWIFVEKRFNDLKRYFPYRDRDGDTYDQSS